MPANPKSPMAPSMLTLIDALAKRAAEDYLASQAAARRDNAASTSNRGPLPDLTQAA